MNEDTKTVLVEPHEGDGLEVALVRVKGRELLVVNDGVHLLATRLRNSDTPTYREAVWGLPFTDEQRAMIDGVLALADHRLRDGRGQDETI